MKLKLKNNITKEWTINRLSQEKQKHRTKKIETIIN